MPQNVPEFIKEMVNNKDYTPKSRQMENGDILLPYSVTFVIKKI